MKQTLPRLQLRAEQLSKQYQTRMVLNSVSFQMASGDIVGLLGPNGAGKTSCFYLILGIISPDSGHIYLGEQDITQYPLHIRAKMGIGYLPQEASVFRKLSVEDNIMAILETRSHLDTPARQQKLEALLSEFKITGIRHTMGAALSGGERRRVEIARALASEPRFILLDEPFAGVDPISIRDIKAIIRLLSQKGIGVLITDHNVRDTLDICDRAYILHNGHVLSEGKPQALLDNPEVRAVYLGDGFSLYR